MIFSSVNLSRFNFLFFVLLILSMNLYAQETKITGKVIDELTNEPIPFATVVFKNSTIGTNTDFYGAFTLVTSTPTDSIVCTLVGYQPVKMRVKKGQSQTINISLKASKVELKEVEIKAGENPANIIFREIIKHKPDNNPSKLETYQYEVYNKVEFDITNITEDFKNKKLLKPFAFIWDNIDSAETNSKPFLPFFISESISDMYYRNSPQAKKEIIKASKVSGLENATITQFLGDMYQRVELYGNFIELFGKGFVSPISDLGLVYYRYYLLDSMYLDNQWCYKLKFKPRRPQELTFNGEFWVHDSTYAIKKINMRIASDANINWVEDMAIVQEYKRVEDKNWILSKDMFVVDFKAKEDGLGFIGRKSTSYKDFKINETIDDKYFKGTDNIIVLDSSMNKKSDYWDSARHDSLSDREAKIYHMVDTIKTLPAYKTYVDIITTFFTGYKDVGKIELGPYYTLYSFNTVEGNRFRFGARTSDDFSTRLLMSGYLAYGTKDQRFKYFAEVKYMIDRKPRQFIGISYKDDVQQLSQSDNAFQDDNILSSLFRVNPANKLNNTQQEKAWYEIEWFNGFSNKLTLFHGFYRPLGNFDISYYSDDDQTQINNTLTLSEISLFTRFAYREKFISGKIDRISLGSEFPVIQVNARFGFKNVWNSNFDYQILTLRIEDRIKFNPFGYTYWVVSAGRTWQRVAYPLLELHPGNETYFYDYAAFNLMNYFEFVSDLFVTGYATHHFDGFFFDKIPLFRKLKWRELAQIKAAYGRVGNNNLGIMTNPDDFQTLNRKPYIEAGVGVENIFKILRVDFIWRLSYLENPNITPFGIRGSLQLTF